MKYKVEVDIHINCICVDKSEDRGCDSDFGHLSHIMECQPEVHWQCKLFNTELFDG